MRCEPSGNVMRIKFSGLGSGWDGDEIGSRRRVQVLSRICAATISSGRFPVSSTRCRCATDVGEGMSRNPGDEAARSMRTKALECLILSKLGGLCAPSSGASLRVIGAMSSIATLMTAYKAELWVDAPRGIAARRTVHHRRVSPTSAVEATKDGAAGIHSRGSRSTFMPSCESGNRYQNDAIRWRPRAGPRTTPCGGKPSSATRAWMSCQ